MYIYIQTITTVKLIMIKSVVITRVNLNVAF